MKSFDFLNTFIGIRHGEDRNILTRSLNQPLSIAGKKEIETLIINLKKNIFADLDKSLVFQVHHSKRLRTTQTACMLGFDVNLLATEKLNEVYQGDFLLPQKTLTGKWQPLVSAWDAWQNELNKAELLYRFGDPVLIGEKMYKYSEIVGFFEKFGENQAEFSKRVYSFLCEEISLENPSSLVIAVAHQATLPRFQRILDISNKVSIGDFEQGNFVRHVEKNGKRTSIPHGGYVLLQKPTEKQVGVLKKELTFLRKITNESF
jgi:broad specificity phosphatase PhoE